MSYVHTFLKNMSKTSKFFKQGFKAFRVRDINKSVYEIVPTLFPDIQNGIKSMKIISLDEKYEWANGWGKARTEYLQKTENTTQKKLIQKIKKLLKSKGFVFDKRYKNSLFLRFAKKHKAKIYLPFSNSEKTDWNRPVHNIYGCSTK